MIDGLPHLSPLEEDLFFYTVIFASSFSILVSIIVILAYRLIGREVFIAKFVFHQAIADLIYAITILLNFYSVRHSEFCVIVDFFKAVGRNSSMIWAMNMAISIYYQVVLGSRAIEEKFYRLRTYSYLLVFAVALL